MTPTPHPLAQQAARDYFELQPTYVPDQATLAAIIDSICFPPIADREVKRIVDELNKLQSLEGVWYANVGRKTGEQCCVAMRAAASALTHLAAENARLQSNADIERVRADDMQKRAEVTDNALQHISLIHSGPDEWSDQANMIADVVRLAEAAEAKLAAMRKALEAEHKMGLPDDMDDIVFASGAYDRLREAFHAEPAAPDDYDKHNPSASYPPTDETDYRALAAELAEMLKWCSENHTAFTENFGKAKDVAGLLVEARAAGLLPEKEK